VRGRSERAVALPGSSGDVAARRRGTRWPWLIVLVVIGALKVEAYASLVHHRASLIAVLAVGLAVSLLRTRPVAIAVFSAGILGLALAMHPFLAGIGLGLGAFAVLIALFFTISTVLHARQRHASRARPG